MKTFNDLEFKAHPTGSGKQAVMLFPNGYGVSVVRFQISNPLRSGSEIYSSYTDNATEWEVAILKGTEGDWSLAYDTPLTSDVIGHQTDEQVTEIMKQVQQLTS